MRVVAMLLLAVAAGCVSGAGPFVRSVTAGPNHTLVVERCEARFTAWVNQLSTGECTRETVTPAP